MRTTMLAWAGRSVVSAIGSLSATEMKRSGIEEALRIYNSTNRYTMSKHKIAPEP